MALKIIWSPQAASNLEEICDYISKDSEYYAALFAKRVIKIIKNIPGSPKNQRAVRANVQTPTAPLAILKKRRS